MNYSMFPSYCLLKADTPKSIPVADKPLRLGGKVEYLALEEFQKRFGVNYSESIFSTIDISPFKESIVGNVPASQLKEQVNKIIDLARTDLVICNMGEYGHGTFALKDIPKDTVIAIYAGTIIPAGKVYTSDESLGYYNSNMIFSTLHQRGIASFMQHLPKVPKFNDAKSFASAYKALGQNVSENQVKLDIEMYRTVFYPSSAKELVEMENVRSEYLNFNSIPLIAIVTNNLIKAGDQVGMYYGDDYWKSRKITPEFFDQNGNNLAWNLYKRTFGRLYFATFTYTGEFKPLIEAIQKRKKTISIVDDCEKSHNIPAGVVAIALLQINAVSVELVIKNPIVNIIQQ